MQKTLQLTIAKFLAILIVTVICSLIFSMTIVAIAGLFIYRLLY